MLYFCYVIIKQNKNVLFISVNESNLNINKHVNKKQKETTFKETFLFVGERGHIEIISTRHDLRLKKTGRHNGKTGRLHSLICM